MLAHQIPMILGGGFDPSVIFAEMQGAWLEPRIGGMWQENTGTTPTTGAGQTIGKINDLSGYGYNATQATVANRPTLQYVNGLPLVRCDSNDFMTVGVGVINVRRNLLTYTEQFDNAAWLKINASVTPNAAGPDSRPVASVVTEGVGTQVQFSVSQGLAIGNGTYTYSLYVKRNTGSSRGIRLEVTEGCIVNFNPDSGAANSASSYGTGVLLSYGSESAGNGFRRYWITFSTNTITRVFLRLTSSASSGTIGYTGDGIQSFAIYGAQLEVGSTASNYQKVTDWTSEQFSSNGSVYFALNTGMSALHNQSIGTSYSAPIQSMHLYGVVIVPSRLSDQREAQLQTYFEKLAGLR